MFRDPAVKGSKGLIGPINFPKRSPIIPYLLKKCLPLTRNSGYEVKGQYLFREFLKLNPIKKLAISERKLEK